MSDHVIRVRRLMCWSHLDPEAGPIMAYHYGKRMHRNLAICRARKIPWLMLTLTYDRTPYGGQDDPDGPEMLWDAASRDRHVRRFIERLGKSLGCRLTGKWICKTEFHSEGGWLHFHLIVTGFDFMPFDKVHEAWGHGAVRISKGRGRHAFYVAKYASKHGGGYPDWLYDRQPRSVKIWRTSPGFWKPLTDHDREQKELIAAACPNAIDDDDDKPPRRSPRDYDSARHADLEEAFVGPMSIRDKIEHYKHYTRVMCGDDAFDVEVDAHALDMALTRFKCPYMGSKFGWQCFGGTSQDARQAVHIAKLMVKDAKARLRGVGDEAAEAKPSFTCHTHKNRQREGGANGSSTTRSRPLTVLDLAWGDASYHDSLFEPTFEGAA